MLKLRKNKKGFTLVELMVVVVIIGILTAIAIPVYGSITANAKKSACQANQRTIDSAVLMYMAENDSPATINATDSAAIEALLVPKYIAVMPVCKDTGCTYSIVNGVCIASVLAHRIS